MKRQLKTKALYNLDNTIAKPLLETCEYPWEALPKIGSFIKEIGETLDENVYEKKADDIWIAKSAFIYPNNYITGPCIIGENTEVRPGAFIRGNVIVGNNCIVGNSTELKNTILFNKVQVPHYNYVGDSIFGFASHTGAGAITSNVKQDKTNVNLKIEELVLESGLKKFGAMLGDNVEVGCNTVMNPGTVVGKGSRIYPLTMLRGFVPANSIYKTSGELAPIKEKI
ncbi:MAG: UDP-N-acetylglucosamine pyrophosphorylase [Clostridia bacterium]